MTESVTGAGRQDVLSQVRRLVSAAVPAVAMASPEPDPETTSTEGRLLLTPALRVSDPTEVSVARAPDFRRKSLEERIAELEAAVGHDPQEWEPDGSEGAKPHAPQVALRPEFVAARPAGPFGRPVFQHKKEETHPVAEKIDDRQETPVECCGQDATESDVEARHVEIELPGRNDPNDGVVTGVAFARSQAREVLDEASTPDAPDAQSEDQQFPEPTEAHGSMVAAELDETRLREIVRDVLLEELAGPLGEKMTRNIRRLLRREVDRAMALRDFD